MIYRRVNELSDFLFHGGDFMSVCIRACSYGMTCLIFFLDEFFVIDFMMD